MFTNIAEKWQYAHSQSSPAIAVCTPAFLANFVKGPNILEEDLFGGLEHIVLDEVKTFLNRQHLKGYSLSIFDEYWVIYVVLSGQFLVGKHCIPV